MQNFYLISFTPSGRGMKIAPGNICRVKTGSAGVLNPTRDRLFLSPNQLPRGYLQTYRAGQKFRYIHRAKQVKKSEIFAGQVRKSKIFAEQVKKSEIIVLLIICYRRWSISIQN